MVKSFAILILSWFVFEGQAFAAAEQFSCGEYIFRGKLLARMEVGSTLLLYPGTRAEKGILVRGIDADSELQYRDRSVEMKAYVYVKGEAVYVRAKYKKKSLTAKVTPELLQKASQLVKGGACKIPM